MIAAPVASTLNAHFGDKQGLEDQHVNQGCPLYVAHALRGEGFDAREGGTGRGTPIVPVAYRTAGDGAVYEEGDVTAPLTTATDPSAQVVAFSAKDYGGDAMENVSPTLRAGGHHGSHANAGVMPAIAIQERAVSENPNNGPDGAGIRQDGAAYTLEARTVTQAVAFDPNQVTSKANRSIPRGDVLHTMPASSCPPHLATPWAVRRLTPTECHRLQGFPDGFCNIPWRGKDHAPDGPQYKALGNSMAVNVMEWLGRRIEMVEAKPSSHARLVGYNDTTKTRESPQNDTGAFTMPFTLTLSADTMDELAAQLAEASAQFNGDDGGSDETDAKPKATRKPKAKPAEKKAEPAEEPEKAKSEPEPEKKADEPALTLADVREKLAALIGMGEAGSKASVEIIAGLGAKNDQGLPKADMLKPEQFAECIELVEAKIEELTPKGVL